MTTLWWLVVLWLACSFAFVAGWVIRAEMERYNRHVYDIDFTRRGIGT